MADIDVHITVGRFGALGADVALQQQQDTDPTVQPPVFPTLGAVVGDWDGK